MLDAAISNQESAYIQHALRIHELLAATTDLSPRNRDLNQHLSAFVRDTMRPRSSEQITAILAAPEIQKIMPFLRERLGNAEYAMELFSAKAMCGLIGAADDFRAYASFDDFIYMDNYRALVDLELKAMGWPTKMPGLNPETQSIAFVGAGPLPISAILFHLKTGMRITCIDSDPAACEMGSRLIRHLAKNNQRYRTLGDKMGYVVNNGAAHDYVTHPIIFIASLVGNKDAVLTRIQATSNTHATVLIRTAEGLSQLLYQPYEFKGGMEDYNTYLARKTPVSETAINTTYVCKFPSGKHFPKEKARWNLNDARDLNGFEGFRKRCYRKAQPGTLVI